MSALFAKGFLRMVVKCPQTYFSRLQIKNTIIYISNYDTERKVSISFTRVVKDSPEFITIFRKDYISLNSECFLQVYVIEVTKGLLQLCFSSVYKRHISTFLFRFLPFSRNVPGVISYHHLDFKLKSRLSFRS